MILRKARRVSGSRYGQEGVVEDVAEERRNAGVLGHSADGLCVEVQHLVSAEAGTHQPSPSVASELPGEEGALSAQLFALGVDVVHELVDQGDGDLLDLGLGVGDLSDEDVAGGVYAAFGIGV